MRTIYKYPIPMTEFPRINLPAKSKILSVGVQNRTAYVWAEVDTTEKEVTTRFVLGTTGNTLPENADRFIGTFQIDWFVGHLFLDRVHHNE